LGFTYVKDSEYVTRTKTVKLAKYYKMTKKDYLFKELAIPKSSK